jgi:hypothetical protein
MKPANMAIHQPFYFFNFNCLEITFLPDCPVIKPRKFMEVHYY